MAQGHTKRNGRARPRDLNTALAEAVDAEQRRARAAQAYEGDRAAHQHVSPAAARIIDQLAAIERHVGIRPAHGNFQGAEIRVRNVTVDENRDDRWETQTRATHAVISAVDVKLEALEQRLQLVLTEVPPTPASPATTGASLAGASLVHTPVTPLQATQAEIIARLQTALHRLDALLARIDL